MLSKEVIKEMLLIFINWMLGSQKTLTALKIKTKRRYEQGNTALQVDKIAKRNATKPEILRELFKV